MGLPRRGFLRRSVFSLASFGFVSPAMFTESKQPESSAADPGFVPAFDSAAPAPTETAAIRAQIEANNHAVGHAIVTMDFAALEKLWAPVMEVNSPGNNILTREQVFVAMREDKLKYSSSKAVPEAFFVSGDIAIEMGHDDIVMANGPMAGRPLTRRFTNIWQKMGDGWVQIARQATYVGIDGGAVYGHPDPTLKQ
jgi:ketosteroid isomerase-like protein